MNSAQRLIVFGPSETLKRLGPALIDEVKAKYIYEYKSREEEREILVAVFEEYQRQLNSSTSLTAIFEFTGKSLKIEMLPTGGRMGFRGSSIEEERHLGEIVADFVNDFAKRYGLTVKEIETKPMEEDSE